MEIIINRGKVVLLDELPEYSIALDGFVSGPSVNCDRHCFSFDHHGDCLRFCTLATCQQVWTALRLGLVPDQYTIYINDVDSDTCMSVWLLQNYERVDEPLVKKLVDAVGILDAHAGAISSNGMGKTIEWIFAPETDSKRNRDYEKLSEDGLNTILEATLHRIDSFCDAEAGIEIAKQHKHGEYKIIRNENDWVLVESSDPHVLANLFQNGFERVVVIRLQSDGTNCVTLARKSDFIDRFPVRRFYTKLNAAENEIIQEVIKENPSKSNDLDGQWNGGSSLGGSPRHKDGSRSRLPISKLTEIIDLELATYNSVVN